MPLETWEGGFDFFAGEDGAFVFPLDLEPGDIAHIARCSPDRIRAIATDFAALEARATELENLSMLLEAERNGCEARATAAEKRVRRLEAALTELVDAQSNAAGLQAEGKEARLLLNDMACVAEDIPEHWLDSAQCVTAVGYFRRAAAIVAKHEGEKG